MQNRMMITGAGSGLGREIALRWAREGWQLALSDVSEPGLQETLKQVREAGGMALPSAATCVTTASSRPLPRPVR